jgi:hypothetical protein
MTTPSHSGRGESAFSCLGEEGIQWVCRVGPLEKDPPDRARAAPTDWRTLSPCVWESRICVLNPLRKVPHSALLTLGNQSWPEAGVG